MDATASDAKILLERLFLRYVTSSSNVDGGTIVTGGEPLSLRYVTSPPNVDGGTIDDTDDDDADDASGSRNHAKSVEYFKNSLEAGRWLSDVNIKAFFDELNAVSGLRTVDSLLNGTVNEADSRDLLETGNTIFFPRNWRNNHWTLGVVSWQMGSEKLTFRHHDSLPEKGRREEAFKIVKRLLGVGDDRIDLSVVTSSVKQQDGTSCGLYVCLYATLETFWPGLTLNGRIDPKDLTTFREKMRDGLGVSSDRYFTPEAARDLITFAKKVVEEKLPDARPANLTAFKFPEISRTGEDFTLSDRKDWYLPSLISIKIGKHDRIFIVYKFDVRVLVNVETLPAEKRKIVEKIAGGASHVIVDEDLLHALHGWERRTADADSFDLDAVVDALAANNSSVDFDDPLLDNDPNDISSVRTSDFGEDDLDVRALNSLPGRDNAEPVDPNQFNSGPVPERKKVWSSIHDIASGADALFGLGPFAGRENPPPRPVVVEDADPVLLEAQIWLNA